MLLAVTEKGLTLALICHGSIFHNLWSRESDNETHLHTIDDYGNEHDYHKLLVLFPTQAGSDPSGSC